jgi:hypothetical protein
MNSKPKKWKLKFEIVMLFLVIVGISISPQIQTEKLAEIYSEDQPLQQGTGTGTSLWVDDGVAISTAANNQYNPEIVSDGLGGSIITWEDYRNGNNYDIYAQRIDSDGNVLWTVNGVAICTAADTQSEPQIISDSLGGAIITWKDYRGGSNYDIYAQRIDADGNVLWTANGVAICTAADSQSDLQIISDGLGGAIITWHDYRSGNNNDIYAQWVNSSGNVVWATNGVAICTASSNQEYPKIISSGLGGAIITWKDYRSGFNFDIYAQQVNSLGNVVWASNGVAICTDTEYHESQQIASDEMGGAFITWQDYRGGSNYDIYIQHINYTGNVVWAANGVAICTAAQNQLNPEIVSDGVGGAIITWEDYRSDSNYDIYAQRINSTGSVEWTTNGVSVCTINGDQKKPQIINDGVGGALITWYDYRSGSNYDIFTQRIDFDGNVLWTANGVAFCTAVNHQTNPQIVNDGLGGAIITWQDIRGGSNYDIYAQRIDNVEDYVPNCITSASLNAQVGDTAYINWTLIDDYGAGVYRVLVNNLTGDWFSWTNGSTIQYPVNTTIPGTFNYTIQYNDDLGQFGSPETIILEIIEIIDNVPSTNLNEDLLTYVGAKVEINWTLVDDVGGGHYRVLLDNTTGTWTSWTNNTEIKLMVDTSAAGTFNYTLQYNDSSNQFGVQESIIVGVIDNIPTKNTNGDLFTYISAVSYINWTLVDDVGGGQYRVLLDNTTGTWTSWTNNTLIKVLIDTTVAGTFNYTIQFTDSAGQFGISETILVTVIDTTPAPNTRLFIEMLNETYTETIFNFTLKILDANGVGIEGATIQFWWNATECTGNMTELGGGLYRINVTAITVTPVEAPIKLNFTISKIGYTNKIFEKYVAVDPDNVVKSNVGGPGNTEGSENFWQQNSLAIILVGAVGGVIGVSLVFRRIKKKKKT